MAAGYSAAFYFLAAVAGSGLILFTYGCRKRFQINPLGRVAHPAVQPSSPDRLPRKDLHAHDGVAVSPADPDVAALQHLHDLRLVRASEVQGAFAASGHHGELGHRVLEYWLAVPANRWGSAVYSAAQLKTMQEVITLVVFAGFSVLYLKEPLGWNHALGFAFIAAGAFFIFHKWS
jgi:uncharacterized protein (DUF486 family)